MCQRQPWQARLTHIVCVADATIVFGFSVGERRGPRLHYAATGAICCRIVSNIMKRNIVCAQASAVVAVAAKTLDMLWRSDMLASAHQHIVYHITLWDAEWLRGYYYSTNLLAGIRCAAFTWHCEVWRVCSRWTVGDFACQMYSRQMAKLAWRHHTHIRNTIRHPQQVQNNWKQDTVERFTMNENDNVANAGCWMTGLEPSNVRVSFRWRPEQSNECHLISIDTQPSVWK